jgi:hypothetical protein
MPVAGGLVETDIAQVRLPGRDAQEARSVAADEDGRALRPGRARVTGGVLQLVPAAAERATAAPQHPHDVDSLAQRRDPLPR